MFAQFGDGFCTVSRRFVHGEARVNYRNLGANFFLELSSDIRAFSYSQRRSQERFLADSNRKTAFFVESALKSGPPRRKLLEQECSGEDGGPSPCESDRESSRGVSDVRL